MEKRRYIGVACTIISEIFGMAYLITNFISLPFDADSAALLTKTCLQLILVVFMLIGFFANRTRLLFGTVLVSMVYNGLSYFMGDVEDTYPMDTLFARYGWGDATYMMVYAAVDFVWIIGVILVFAATFAKATRKLIDSSIIIFFSLGTVLLLNIIFAAVGMAQDASSDASGIIGCIGDGFTLYAYALALGFAFNKEKAVVDDGISPNGPSDLV
jgi:hypothetical protein